MDNKMWRAFDKRGNGIVRVMASDEAEAILRVAQQLNREGRRPYYESWIAGGMVVKEIAE